MSKSLNQINKEIKNADVKLKESILKSLKMISDINTPSTKFTKYDKEIKNNEAKLDILKEMKRKFLDASGIIDEKRIIYCAKRSKDGNYNIINKKTGAYADCCCYFTIEKANNRIEEMNANKYYNGMC